MEKLNCLFFFDIVVYVVKWVKDDVYVCFDVIYCIYKYYVIIWKDLFNCYYVWRFFNLLDFEKMNEVVCVLFDYIDFISFSKLYIDVKMNNCWIMYVEWM